jgi:N-acetylmuramoyl-L-alanine amidase
VNFDLRDVPSLNHDARPDGTPIDILVLHYTGMTSPAEALARLLAPDAKVSSHYMVDLNGIVWRLVPEARRAWHAGASFWHGRTRLNDRSIGIEIANPGHSHGYPDYPALQMAVVCDLCLDILSRHAIAARDIVGHSDIAPDRKDDPGEKFDWRGLAQAGVGLWPEGVPDLGITGIEREARVLRDVRAALAMVGYRMAPEGGLDPALSQVLRAFQRHWRPETVNGQADAGTIARLAAVARLCGAG